MLNSSPSFRVRPNTPEGWVTPYRVAALPPTSICRVCMRNVVRPSVALAGPGTVAARATLAVPAKRDRRDTRMAGPPLRVKHPPSSDSTIRRSGPQTASSVKCRKRVANFQRREESPTSRGEPAQVAIPCKHEPGVAHYTELVLDNIYGDTPAKVRGDLEKFAVVSAIFLFPSLTRAAREALTYQEAVRMCEMGYRRGCEVMNAYRRPS